MKAVTYLNDSTYVAYHAGSITDIVRQSAVVLMRSPGRADVMAEDLTDKIKTVSSLRLNVNVETLSRNVASLLSKATESVEQTLSRYEAMDVYRGTTLRDIHVVIKVHRSLNKPTLALYKRVDGRLEPV